MFRISVTDLALLRECPRCFFYEVLGLSRPRGMFTSMPSALDKIIQAEVYAFGVKRSKPLWLGKEKNIEILNIRKKLTAAYRSIEVVGILDDLLKDADGYTIVDYKTSGYLYSREKAKFYYATQMNIYAWLCEKNGIAPVRKGLLIFFTPSQTKMMNHEANEVSFSFDVTPVELNVDIDAAEDVLEEAHRVLMRTEPPMSSDTCEWCYWLKQRGR